jgi:uncharacterized protein
VTYVQRTADTVLARLLATFPAVMVVGPRACGKTTTASRHAASISRLDLPAVAAAFASDPDSALAERSAPALLDEWQEVPSVLGAVKRSVDAGVGPGQILLTGSVSAEITGHAWPGTGRLIRMPMQGLTMGEKTGRPERRSLRRVLSGDVTLPSTRPDLAGYVDAALAGGFPESWSLDPRDRRVWFDAYVEQMVTRDVARLGPLRDAARLRTYLQAWALNSAGVVDDTTIYEAARIDRKTHVSYEQLLRNLFVVDIVPAWTTNRLKRLALAPKRFVLDGGLWAAAARIGRDVVLNDAHLLGRAIETMTYTELRAAAAFDDARPLLHHLRTAGGRQEIDLIVEFDGGEVFGVEIKATSAPTRADARHLVWLREQLGASFSQGVVLHTGSESYALDERILALPICALWGATAET